MIIIMFRYSFYLSCLNLGIIIIEWYMQTSDCQHVQIGRLLRDTGTCTVESVERQQSAASGGDFSL